jgi:hypothetical protein
MTNVTGANDFYQIPFGTAYSFIFFKSFFPALIDDP